MTRPSDLYHRALALPPGERSAYLDAMCGGDLALREDVESLLRHDAVEAGVLDRGAFEVLQDAGAGPASMAGRRFGPYQILAPVGAGGMGIVYRARDTKLRREVALKILPPHLVSDPERRARFAREARLLATLNHPNIAAIHGLEEADGLTALVLELVEGPTLADRLETGPLPLAEALAIARQVADALDEAHGKGIVHRDLKPANIALQSATGSGDVRVKVLDFGLAKSIARRGGPDLASGGASQHTATADGRILGTPAYMSPEQARGLAVDKRTDIWAFGCVVFEMLTGRQAFEGETITDTLARILEHEPDWTALPASTPAAVRTLLRRCLRKGPARRLHDIADARIELEELDVTGGGTAVDAAHRPPAAQRRLPWLIAAVSTAIAAVRDHERGRTGSALAGGWAGAVLPRAGRHADGRRH